MKQTPEENFNLWINKIIELKEAIATLQDRNRRQLDLIESLENKLKGASHEQIRGNKRTSNSIKQSTGRNKGSRQR